MIAFACGLVFAIGLGFSGMLRPEKVIGFLEWKDPSLLFVMGPAVLIYAAAAWKRRGPEKPLDVPLVAGAAIFGIGWGLTGVCPGPALVNLVQGRAFFAAFGAALVVGMLLRATFSRPRTSAPPTGR